MKHQSESSALRTRATVERISAKNGVRSGYRHIHQHLWHGIRLVLLVQGPILLIAAPVLAFVFSEGVRAAGLHSLTTANISDLVVSPAGISLAVGSLALTVIAITAQVAIFLIDAKLQQSGIPSSFSNIAKNLFSLGRRLSRRWDTLLLIPYFILLVPLAHVGVNSALAQWVSVPAFVSDELLKQPLHAALYTITMLAIWYVSIRLAFILPALVASDMGVAAAFATSWRATRWRSLHVLLMFAAVSVPLFVLYLCVGLSAVFPVWLTDTYAPAVSPVLGAVMFGLAQFLIFIVSGLAMWTQAQILMAAIRRSFGRIEDSAAQGRASNVRWRYGWMLWPASVLALALLSVHSYATINEAAPGNTTILAHRGFVEGGVENTIPALEAAAEVQSDIVELDVQQTLDGEWVLMHDPDLERLAGLKTSIAKLTAEEATAVEVHDGNGNTSAIPSLESYVQRANELGQTLLVEIKVHGGETPDYLDRLIATVDQGEGTSPHIYHALSAKVVDEMKQQHPERAIGYIVPISYGGVPEESSADFLVVEQSVYSVALMQAVHDSGFELYVWTVEEPEDMRALFRDGVDGIISDRPDLARTELANVKNNHRVLTVLFDNLRKLLGL